MDFYSCDPLEKTPRESTRDPSLCFFQPTSPIHSRPTCKSRRAHCQGYHGSLSMSPLRRASICRPHPLCYGTTTRLSPSLPKEAPILCHCEVYFSPYPLPTWVSETTQWFSINFFSLLTPERRTDWQSLAKELAIWETAASFDLGQSSSMDGRVFPAYLHDLTSSHSWALNTFFPNCPPFIAF